MEKDVWVTSSYCGNGACVEVKATGASIAARVTGGAEQLGFTREEWAAFVAGVKAGEFDL